MRKSIPLPAPRSAALGAAVAFGTVLALGGPAAAHAGVTASDARALAKNVTLTFTSEAESRKTGLAKLQIVLPQGISPGAVSLKKAPEGWTFAQAQGGYTVAGRPLPAGTDAVHSVVVAQLPDAGSLVFKVVETYGDGEVARWIEAPQGAKRLANPAPVLRLGPKRIGATVDRAAPARSEPGREQSPSPAASPTALAALSKAEETGEPEERGEHRTTAQESKPNSHLNTIIEVIAAVLILGGGLYWIRKRRRDNGS
jgi:uncharacterized protein YcnI